MLISKIGKRLLLVTALLVPSPLAAAAETALTKIDVDPQPIKAQVRRLVQALDNLGAPPVEADRKKIDEALADNEPGAVAKLQAAVDPLCLAVVNINAESRVKVAQGPARCELVQQGWRVFVIKVINEAGVTSRLRCESPNARPIVRPSSGSPEPKNPIAPQDVLDRWLDVQSIDSQPMTPKLSGLGVEYRLVQLFARDAGQREATLSFDVGQGTQDLGFRNEIHLLFDCAPAKEVELEVLDADGAATTGQFIFKDEQGRVYPARSRRLAPDLFFHDQVYRHSGESILLPAGTYDVTYTRGPEYRIGHRRMIVSADKPQKEIFKLERWIKLADHGWYSGDHHIHAAGCAHYETPTEGVTPADMMRHVLGEDLNVGCVLAWGPCWYFQKQYFEGKVNALSKAQNLMRYDVEVSGFPSSHSGHLCLLRLSEDDYKNTTRIEQWPSWDLPVLKWGKEQGGVVGFSHSGWGLSVPSTNLPNYDMPAFDGIGANEYIVDVTSGVCDFISAVDTPITWELNIWYHTLNCGYTTRISGETDFPCIYGDRVGLGRAYVKLNSPAGQPLDYDAWVQGIKNGRSYCSDGLTHLFDFSVGGLGVGEAGEGGEASKLAAKSGEPLAIAVNAAAMLPESPDGAIQGRPLDQKPYWHVERARIGKSREVAVELIVNGEPVERKAISADGTIQQVTFNYIPTKSCWIATRVFPAAHTNPVFVEVGGKPIRANRKSAQWCLDAVDVCWKAKVNNIRPEEREAARSAYDSARAAYKKILSECPAD